MSALASLLVRDDALPVGKIQEAIQQQVMQGGNLDTVLLELGYLPENVVNAYCAAVHDLLPATREEVMDAPVETTRLLPAQFAAKYRAIPVAKTPHKVVLAVDRPLAEPVLEEIAHALDRDPVERVVCSVRLDAGLARHYEIELSQRMRHLTRRLQDSSAGTIPYVAPYDGETPRSSLHPQQSNAPITSDVVPSNNGWQISSEPPPERSESPVPTGTFSRKSTRQDRASFRAATQVPPPPVSASTQYNVTECTPEVLGRPLASGSAAARKLPPVSSQPPERASVGRLRRVTPAERERVPSVIVEVGQDVEQLIDTLWDASPYDVDQAISLLVSAGERALPALVREFPGPLWFDRRESFETIPAGREISPIACAFVAFGDRAVPYIVSLLDRPDPDLRFYSTLLASEFIHPSLVIPVGRRIFDPDPDVATVAFRALMGLRVCHPEFDQLVERVRAIAKAKRDPSTQATAIEALGRLRDADSIEFLISLLDEEDERVTHAAHASLVRLCCQDFGLSARKWNSWVSRHRTSHRVEWLIDGLTHSDLQLRRRAGDELRHVTQEYFGYHAGLPKHDRQVAQRKYRHWWQQRGRRLFAAS